MKPSAFDYIRVETLAEALSVLAEEDLDAKLLAGGQSLLPVLNMRLAQPKTLVDINKLPGLDTIQLHMHTETARLEVGALVKQRALERYALEEPRAHLLHAALLNIGHPQTRNMGTVGGSLVHADPAAELPLLFTTLGGTIVLHSLRGERQVAAADFFQDTFSTAIEPDELLTSIVWHLPTLGTGVAFKEFRRRHGDFALVAAACTMQLDHKHAIQQVHLSLSGVTGTPLLIDAAQELVGEQWTKEHGRALAERVSQQFDLADDFQASASYRRQLAKVALARVLEDAYKDALAKEDSHATHKS